MSGTQGRVSVFNCVYIYNVRHSIIIKNSKGNTNTGNIEYRPNSMDPSAAGDRRRLLMGLFNSVNKAMQLNKMYIVVYDGVHSTVLNI